MKTKPTLEKKQANLASALQEALKLHRQGELDRAERLYVAVLDTQPGHFDALRHLAVLRSQQGRHREGLDLIEAALKLNPSHASVLSNFGLILMKSNRPEEALAKLDAALALEPEFALALNNRGNALLDLRRPREALASYDAALASKPDFADAHNNRGNALQALGRPEEALAAYEKALAIRPDYVEALCNRGNALTTLERLSEALASYDQALAIRPDHAEALVNLAHARSLLERGRDPLDKQREHAERLVNHANALLNLGRLLEALASYDNALALQPDHVDALNNRGIALQYLDRCEEALASYDKVLALRPDYAGAYNNRSVALQDLGRQEEALENAERALALLPNHAGALYNRGNSLQDLGRPEEALASYDRALAIQPDYVEARFNRGMTALAMGRFAEGWAGYEYRWQQKGTPKKLIDAFPAWKGEDIGGKRILVHEEQGVGDIIQFSRFLTRLSALGASVDFLVRSSLHRLLRPLAPTVRVVDKISSRETFDFQCALMSLPAILGTSLESLPAAVPCLTPEASLVDHWRRRIGESGFRIGICWQGKPGEKIDRGRSIPLRCFQPLASLPGVRLISLQKNHGLEQLSGLPEGMRIENLGAELDLGPDAFVDTAAAMSCLDLIVTSDTSIAHLAGALGRPVWALLKHAPDWRWLLDRIDSPWHPTMKLYRQSVRDDWSGVFARVAADVAEAIAERARETALAPKLGRALKEAMRWHQRGDLDRAERGYAAILEARPGHSDAMHYLAVIRSQQGRYPEGLRLMEAAMKANPANAPALSNFGLILTKLGRPEEALAKYDAALVLDPRFAMALSNRGNALRDLARPEEALASYDAALAVDPAFADAHNNRGNALLDLGRPEEALASYDRALAIEPDHVEAHCNRGHALIMLERPEEALASYDKALAIAPGHAEAHFNRGTTALSIGDFPAGWASYEYRWEQKTTPRKLIDAYPAWKGEDLGGKRIIVHEEQGFGDVIQFSRFLPHLAQLGASVAFLVRPSLHRLLRPFASTVRLIGQPPQGESFDYQCALSSLPGVLGTTVETIPADVPYLTPEAPLVDHWRQRIGEHGLRIGICWQGKPGVEIDRARSVPLRCFFPLAAIPGARLISLQKADGLEQLSDLPTLENLGAELDNGPDAFVDTAALMSSLDLIVTSDTSIAHLAGALGRPVWVALKRVPDWRWLLHRSDSPWYPTMKLYRQSVRGDWDGVVARIAADARKPRAAAPPESATVLRIPGSVGELFDKIAILEIKAARIEDPDKLRNVAHELDLLRAQQSQFRRSDEHDRLAGELKRVNETLWEIEDAIRECERRSEFGAEFISLARSVYKTNDRRAEIKKQLNVLHGSSLVEEKNYAKYE